VIDIIVLMMLWWIIQVVKYFKLGIVDL